MAAEEVRTPEQIAEAEITKFRGVATKDGEIITSPKPEEHQTAAEAARATQEAKAAAQGAAAAGEEEAPTEEAAPQEKTAAQVAAAAIAAARGDKPSEEAPETEEGAETEETEEAGETPDGAQPRPKKSAQERINQAVAKQRAAERAAEQWKALAERQAAQPQPPQAQVTQQPASGDQAQLPPGLGPLPDPTKYEYGQFDARYTADLSVWQTHKVLLEDRHLRQRQEQAREEENRIRARVKEISDGALDKYPDFHQVVVEGAGRGDYPISVQLGELILGSPYGADIAYALATDIPEAVRVSRLSPLAQAAYFGRLEGQFAATQSAQPAQAPVIPSKAPAPPARQARGQSGNPATVRADTSDFAAFERLAMAKRK